MPTRDEIYTAIRNADAAGDTASVVRLGDYLKTMDAANHAKAAAAVAGDSITQGARNFANDMGPVERFVAGYGKAGADLVRGAGQLIPGLVSRDDVAESRRLDAPLMATTAGKAGNITGNVAALAPTALIPGANTIAGGAAIGAATGLLQPSTSTGETIKNIGLGGAGGAAVPALVTTLRTAKAAAEPFYEAGKNAIVGRALNRAAGKDAAAVAQRLQEAATPFVGPSQGVPRTTMGELVPGSMPTVGQASENAGVAALERAASATNPEVTNAVSDILKAQNSARTGVINDIAGNDGRREFFDAARSATADQLYGQARRLGVDPSKLTPEALQNVAQFAQRVPDEVIGRAKQLAKINGTPMTDATSIEGMHWMKLAIDDLIGAADRAGNGTLKRAYTGLQKDLLTGMDNLSPAYQTARKTFAAMSKPINQMDVGQAIADKSINRLTGNLQPNAYANALTDATAARATGMPGATLEGVMDPAQMNALGMVLQDVQRANAAQNLGRGAGSDTVQKLAYTNVLDQSGVPTLLRNLAPAQVIGNLASRGADAAYGRANRELSNRLAEVMLDPAQASRLMTQATPQEMSQLLKLITRSASGLAIAAPASANAAQQQ